MRSPFHYHRKEMSGGRGSSPTVILEAPHTSNHMPNGDNSISKERLESHEGYDIGASELAMTISFALAASIVTSSVSRLYVEHNRVPEFALPEGVTGEEGESRLKKYHTPYVNAVSGMVDEVVNRDRLPILVSVHTYTPELNGKKRKPFAVMGDKKSVLVNFFAKKLEEKFHVAGQQQKLINIFRQFSQEDTNAPVAINDPYNLAEDSEFRYKVQGAQYAKAHGFPWATLEVRNDLAHLPAIQGIVISAMQAVLESSLMRVDLAWREAEYFSKPKPPQSHPGGESLISKGYGSS